MTKKSGTYEEYERPRVYLKPAGRLLEGIMLECLMTVKIGAQLTVMDISARPDRFLSLLTTHRLAAW
jgi:hypothetical protein